MRPQSKFLLIVFAIGVTITVFVEASVSRIEIRDQMRQAVNCENSDSISCRQRSDARLAYHVAQLTSGRLHFVQSFGEGRFPQQQFHCQRAIVDGSTSYVVRWIDAIEQGRTPEWANQHAARALEPISDVCNVSVVQNSSGTTMPSAGGPCASLTDQPHMMVDSHALRSCLQQTLEFWTSYLYVPSEK